MLLTWLSILSSFFSPIPPTPVLANQQSGSKPNIVIIQADDMTLKDLKWLKNKDLFNLSFSQATVSLSQCCPSRAALLTGQYAHNNHVTDNQPPFGGYESLDAQEIFPLRLQEQGYKTAFFGKYLNGYGQEERVGKKRRLEIPPGWDHWRGLIDHTAYWMYDFIVNKQGQAKTIKNQYQTTYLTDEAVKFIKESNPKTPFYLQLSPLAPHRESEKVVPDPKELNPRPAKKDIAFSKSLKMPLSKTFNSFTRKEELAFNAKAKDLSHFQTTYQGHVGSLIELDRSIKRVFNALKANGKLNDTLFIFTSDNGLTYGKHGQDNGKGTPYEEAVRVPLLMRTGENDADISTPVSNVDLAPTFLDLAGAPYKDRDGFSLLSQEQRQYELLEGTDLEWQGIRSAKWSYVDAAGARFLWDLENDPQQKQSISEINQGSITIKQLQSVLKKARSCAARACRQALSE